MRPGHDGAIGHAAEFISVELDISRESIATIDGFPVLDRTMQSSVPGLHFTNMAATRQFGPFMAFTVSVAPMKRALGLALAEDSDAR